MIQVLITTFEGQTQYKAIYLNSKVQIIINNLIINEDLEIAYQIFVKIKKWHKVEDSV